MSLALFKKLLRDIRVPLLLTALLLLGYEMLWVKVAERIIEQFKMLSELLPLETMLLLEKKIFAGPGQVIRAMLGGELINLNDSLSILSIGYVHPFMQAVICVWAIGRAAGALAGELDRGTMELLLAQPIPRRQIVLAHLAIDLLVIPGLCVCLIVGTWLGMQVVALPGGAVDLGRFVGPLLNAGALMFAVSGYTMALSALGRYRWRVVSWALGTMLVMFLLNVFGQLWNVLTPARPLTVFFYYQPQMIMLHGQWTASLSGAEGGPAVNVIVVLLLIGAGGYAAALWTFTRRDLPAPL